MKTTTLLLVIGLLVAGCFTQAIAQVNDRPDLILVGVDNPDGDNAFRYVMGSDLSTSGSISNWSGMIQLSELGFYNAGGGAAVGYIDDNQQPDLILMGVDNPDGPNKFWYRIGWNLDAKGTASVWGDMKTVFASSLDFHGPEFR